MSLNFAKDSSKTTILGSVKKASHTYGEVLLIVVVAGLFYGFLAKPKAADLSVQKQALAKLQSESKALGEDLDNLNSLVERLKAVKNSGEIENLDESLPLEGKVISINRLIKIFAQESGVTLSNFLISGKNGYIVAGNIPLLQEPFGQKRSLQKLSGDITVLGSLEQITNFIKKIENSPRIVQITALEITGAKEGGLSSHLSIEIYYYE